MRNHTRPVFSGAGVIKTLSLPWPGFRLLLLFALVASSPLAGALPIVSGFNVEVFALVTDPVRLTFAPDGTVFSARDNVGSGGGFNDAVKIHRISPSGTQVTEYGNAALMDPDAILFDSDGAISGVPDSVLVGGGGIGVVAIRPNQTIDTIFESSQVGSGDVDGLVIDNTGRLLILSGDQVRVTNGSQPTVLIDALQTGTSTPQRLAVDAADEIFLVGQNGGISKYSSDGNLVSPDFASGFGLGADIAFGNGGAFGYDLYAMSSIGDLFRVAENGNAALLGTGFAAVSDFPTGGIIGGSFIGFGPDGALYVSEFPQDRILRITAQQSVPEPTTLAILAFGLGGIGVTRRRRSNT